MRRALLLGLVVLAGCGRGKPEGEDPAPETPAPVTGGGPKVEPKAVPKAGPESGVAPETKPDPASRLPQSLGVRYDRRTAADWGADLLDIGADGALSVAASNALFSIGGEGLRFALPALESPYPRVRYNGLAAIRHTVALDYPDVFVPRLVKLLGDPDPSVRGYAALVIGRAKFGAAGEALSAKARAETNAEARRQMNAGLKELGLPAAN